MESLESENVPERLPGSHELGQSAVVLGSQNALRLVQLGMWDVKNADSRQVVIADHGAVRIDLENCDS